MENRKVLRIGKSVVHGRTGPLRGDMEAEEQKEVRKKEESNKKDIIKENNSDNKKDEQSKVETQNTEDILNKHYNKEDTENNSGNIFEQLLQRELAKGTLGGGVVEKNTNKLKFQIEENNIMDTANGNIDEDMEKLSKISLQERINSTIVKYRMHAYNEILKCFNNQDNDNQKNFLIDKKIHIVNNFFKDEDSIFKYLSDNNLICQIKTSEITEAYLHIIKDIYFHNYKNEYNNEEELINSFVNEYRNKLHNMFLKIYILLIEKILINTKSFDFGCNIIIKIIEYCSYDKITLSIITTICEYLNSIFLKANKNVSNIKGVKIKVIASILLLFYKLLHSFGPHIICVKTINKYCLKFNEMMDKAVKTNFYSLYIEILTQVNIQEFHNSILNELSSQQRNYINKELQNKPKHTDNTTNATTLYKATYILKTNDHNNSYNFMKNFNGNTSAGNGLDNHIVEEFDVFKDICTKQWEKRVLEGCIDKNNSTNNTNNNSNSNNNNNNSSSSKLLSNENLLPWKIKVEAINLLCDKMKSKYNIKKTNYLSTLLNIILKLLKSESALPVVVSTLKLLHILIEKFDKDIYNTVKNFSFILCSKLKDSNKQVSNACMECLTKAISVYNIDLFLDDLSKNLKDKNNNTRLVTLDFLLKTFQYIDKKSISSLIDITKHLLNDTVANIKNTACKLYALIISYYGESVDSSFFNSIPSNKKKSILSLCVKNDKLNDANDENISNDENNANDENISNDENNANDENNVNHINHINHGYNDDHLNSPKNQFEDSSAKKKKNVDNINKMTTLKGNNMKHTKNNISDDAEDIISGGKKNINTAHNNNMNKSCNINNINNVEYYLPKDMIKNLGSSNIPNKIEGLQMLNIWIKNENNIMILNFEDLINFIKKNCYEFKGKNVVLNNAIYDIFYEFIDIAYQYNLKNNTSFYKMLNILISLYIEKVTDKKGNMLCNNFLHKCFMYFDNNIIIDLFLKNIDSKNTKKCEECIKILQKIFINRNKNSGVNIKNLIYFLKKFVDSKNSNLKKSSILMLQILSKNFGDKYVLSHLEGISENIRHMVKLKEDVEKFVSKHGLNYSTSILLKDMDRQHNHINDMATRNININLNTTTDMNNNNNINSSNVRDCETFNKCDIHEGDGNNITINNQGKDTEIGRHKEKDTEIGRHKEKYTETERHREKDTFINNTNDMNNNINQQNKKDEEMLDIIIKKRDFSLEGEEKTNKKGTVKSPINNSSKLNNIQIDYTNNYLNYNNTNISDNTPMDISKGVNNIKENKHEKNYKNDEVKNYAHNDEEEEDDEEEKMILIIDHIKNYINRIISDNNNNNGNNNGHNNGHNIISNSVSNIINVIEKIGKYYINPEKLDILINDNILNKIYNNNKNKCIQLLYVLIFSLKENTHIYADILFEFIVSIIDDIDISVEQIDKLLTCMCRNLGISKYINHINTYILNEKFNNMNDDYSNQNNMNSNSNSYNNFNITDRSKEIKKDYKRNKILIVINNINTNHILLLNESVIKKKILTFYLDLFFDDNEQIRERASIVLDNVYSKYGRNVFFSIYEKLSAHKKECLQDILNQMKLNKDDFSFYKIFLSNNSQLKRISMNESNLSGTTPTLSKTKSVKRLNSFTKNKTMNIDFPTNYKIKTDKLKWDKHLDHNHSNYLMKEFKSFATSELISTMFSDKPHIINRSLSFFKDYISNSINQSTIFSKSGFLDLLLKWTYYTLYGHKNNNEILSASINLIRIILKTIEDNYVFLNDQELVTLVNFLFDKINASTICVDIRNKLKEIFLCLCYISNHKLYFNLLLKSLPSCDQRRLNDSLDIILKLIILYKEKCINIEKDIMKILQVFTVHSKNKTVTIYCLKIFANIQSFYPNFYKCIENDEISFYLKSKVDEFIEKCPDFNVTLQDTESEYSKKKEKKESNSKDVEINEFVNYIKNNANQRMSIKKDVEDHVNGFNKDVEEILEIKKKIEEFEINKTNDDYINNQISYTSISNDLNFVMDGNNYSKTKEINNIMESNLNEKIKGLNNYKNSIIYFRFVYLTSLLYSNDIETISKVCNLIVDNTIYVGKKSNRGNFLLKENGNYIFKNLNLFIILLKGANYALRYLFRENFESDLNSTSVHLNAILSTLLLLDILMKKKSCVEKLSFDHFSFFFINAIVCLSIYTKVIHKHKHIYRIKDGEIARNLITRILNNLLGREFLSNHTKLLEYVCNVGFNLGFDIINNNNILLDEMEYANEFYISINTYVKILNKIYKKIINRIFEENTTDSRFVYKILNILFMNLNKYDMYLCKMETDKNRKRKMDSEHDENRSDGRLGIINGMIGSNHNINNNNGGSSNNNKKICNEKNNNNNNNNNNNKENAINLKNSNNFNNRFNQFNQKNTNNNIKSVSINHKKKKNNNDNNNNNNNNNNSSNQTNFSFNQNNNPVEQYNSFNNTNRNSNSCYGYNENEVVCNKSDYSIFDCHGTYWENLNIEENNADVFVKNNYEEIEVGVERKNVIREYSKEEMDKINKNKMDFMNTFLFFIQLLFYGIKKNNPLILLAYINHELISKYHDNLKYYFKKMEILLNKDLREDVPNINFSKYSELYTLPFSFDKFINEYNYLKEKESSTFQSYNSVLEVRQHFDSEVIYNNFDLSIDDVIQKKKNFLDSLKMININEITFNDNKYEHLKETILQYINELENKQLFCDIKNAQYLSNYNFISSMYTNNAKLGEEMDNTNNEKQKLYTHMNNDNTNNINLDRRQEQIPLNAHISPIYYEEKNNIQFINKKKETNTNNIQNNETVVNNHFSENFVVDQNKMKINEKDYVTHKNVEEKVREENFVHEELKEPLINDKQTFEYFCDTAYDKFSKEETQELRNIMTDDKKEELENKSKMCKNITTNDATHISHSIYLRNCTMENIDMNKMNDEHLSIGNITKWSIPVKENIYMDTNNYTREDAQNIEKNVHYKKTNELINNDKKNDNLIEQKKNNSDLGYRKDGALDNFNKVFSSYNNNNNNDGVTNHRNTFVNTNTNVHLDEETCKKIENKEYNNEEQKGFKDDNLYKDLFEKEEEKNKGDINIHNKIKENEEKYIPSYNYSKVDDKIVNVDQDIKKETNINTCILINDDDYYIRKEKKSTQNFVQNNSKDEIMEKDKDMDLLKKKNNININNINNNNNNINNRNNSSYNNCNEKKKSNESASSVLNKEITRNDKNGNIIKNTHQTFLRSNKSNVQNLIKKYDNRRESPNVSHKTANSIKPKTHLENTKIVNKANDTFLQVQGQRNISNTSNRSNNNHINNRNNISHINNRNNISHINNRSNISHINNCHYSDSNDTFKTILKNASNNSYHNINSEKENIKIKGDEKSTNQMLVTKSNIGSANLVSNVSPEPLSANTTKNNNTYLLNKKNDTYIEKSKHIYEHKNTNIVSRNNNPSDNYMQNKEYDNKSNATSNYSTKRKNCIENTNK
ncbi:hypothetical protein, variant [Plasmodium falciparum 7G8]|uniref:TOG domain-containing protein n=1 Tax=Plasmodium falciparum (isolate 7G8) TaxID=57266 RepID=W7F9N7_PLAF8|nr:hypothetical protein, variant [Plasmodium falciparum 7G8]